MSNLASLTTQRDGLLKKIREIEAACEGIENENNAKRVQELNLEQAQYSAQRQEIAAKLAVVDGKLANINAEILELSGTGVEKIFAAIKNQRWYFFKNKPKVFMDRDTGILWTNLEYFSYCKSDGNGYSETEAKEIESKVGTIDGYGNWKRPTYKQFIFMCESKTMPFREGDGSSIKGEVWWFANKNGDNMVNTKTKEHNYYSSSAYLILCNSLLCDKEYEVRVSKNNPVYTEKERLQFTLDLFTQNELWPIFNDEAITELYKKLYFEKPKLVEQLQDLENQIKQLQTVTLLSSEFDYTALLAKYDIKAIDASLIKYYQAVQQWCRELMEKVDYYEEQKASVIKDFNLISLKLSRKCEANPNLTEAENILLCDRQRFFQKNFSLGMNSVKTKLLAVKKQADALEYRIDEIDEGENSLRELAELEQEKRASFAFLTENTAKIIKNALRKIEYFEANHTFVMNAINIWENWTEGYRVFKTTYKEDMKHDCEDDGIEEEIWSAWYQDWQQLRYVIELKMQPVIERGLCGSMPTNKEVKTSVPEQLIHILDEYKKQIDKFYKEERKGIYQKFAFQAGGDLQEKFETESSLYKFVAMLQSELQDIIFNCKNAEDRVWILNWANSLLDIQIDEVLKFVANNDLQKISHTILDEFAALKQKNYDIYLADAKAYSEEKARREKAYNSLIFKMRKDLAK
ncbi:hypothetical protein [Phascolarctobacterium succinatutens]|uniref:hypothetical protein n=1 Tax=Phascolarctobacterium succinatutens TaxID=626940 RepID=UPI0026709778|nr:hypothetical protein [Phascolarctobacterium succinatutens]